jgi:hypothetical protein
MAILSSPFAKGQYPISPGLLQGRLPNRARGLHQHAVARRLYVTGGLQPIAWMIASGAGMYVVYTPFNAMLFDGLVAASGRVATAGFLI